MFHRSPAGITWPVLDLHFTRRRFDALAEKIEFGFEIPVESAEQAAAAQQKPGDPKENQRDDQEAG
jgi:hypothetical protein